MTKSSSCYYSKALLRNLFSTNGVSGLLSAFGALWLLVEISAFFLPTTVLYGTTKLPDAIRQSWPTFLILGLAFAIWRCKPRLNVAHKVKGRDISIKIAVGDIFSFPGAIIMGSNTTFDPRIPAVISARSVQGLFTTRYYNGDAQLEAEIATNLNGVAFENLPGLRVGNARRYPVGTCVSLHPRERTGYLVAMSHINEHGTASSSFEDLKISLTRLREHVGTRGANDALLIPVLGTGFARLPQSREEIVHEIIKSFLAACSERTFTDDLTIVIMQEDILKHRISLEELGSFLQYQCNYTDFSDSNRPALGTAA